MFISRHLVLCTLVVFLPPLQIALANVETEAPPLSSWKTVTVGVADLDAALSLWISRFGMEAIAERAGPDTGLASLWDIDADVIGRQVLLRTPGVENGILHLVEFTAPGAPVREGAAVFDLLPKNLDVFVDDLPRRLPELKAAGNRFLNENYSEMTAPNGVTFREIHMPAHDHINVVLLEWIGAKLVFSPHGYAGVGLLITIVPDADAEKAFYRDAVGLELLSDNILEGPEVEAMIGLPPGSGLDVSIWGCEEDRMGQIEIVEYRGVRGEDRYPRARPPATGILHVAYTTPDLAMIESRLATNAVEFQRHGEVETLFGSGRVISFRSPAGLRIEVHERR